MKFVCDRCGKKYATAEDPAPGKVYKLKCKACGHLIVVKGQAGTMTGIPAVTAAELAMASAAQEPIPTPPPSAHPEIELQVGVPLSRKAVSSPNAASATAMLADNALVTDATLHRVRRLS